MQKKKSEDTIGIIRIRNLKEAQCNSQMKKDKQWSAKHTRKLNIDSMNPTKKRRRTQVLQNVKKFLFH
jgi:Fe-S cluster biosynthesis and repair protein YggX